MKSFVKFTLDVICIYHSFLGRNIKIFSYSDFGFMLIVFIYRLSQKNCAKEIQL